MVPTNDAYLYAVRLLGRRAYSCRELAARLTRRGFAAASVNAVVEKLGNQGYLNDRALARQLVDRLLQKNRYSMAYITNVLYQHGIDNALAEEAMAAISDQAEREWQAALFWLHKARPEATARQLAAALARRGFRSAIIARAVDYYHRERLST